MPAEFVEVIRNYVRMQEAHRKGISIPIEAASMSDAVNDPELFERVVMEWAATHPEPKYPTWEEWLEEQGVIGLDDGLYDYSGLEDEIPENIANALDISPKER